jgi:hypothetical protein
MKYIIVIVIDYSYNQIKYSMAKFDIHLFSITIKAHFPRTQCINVALCCKIVDVDVDEVPVSRQVNRAA